MPSLPALVPAPVVRSVPIRPPEEGIERGREVREREREREGEEKEC